MPGPLRGHQRDREKTKEKYRDTDRICQRMMCSEKAKTDRLTKDQREKTEEKSGRERDRKMTNKESRCRDVDEYKEEDTSEQTDNEGRGDREGAET